MCFAPRLHLRPRVAIFKLELSKRAPRTNLYEKLQVSSPELPHFSQQLPLVPKNCDFRAGAAKVCFGCFLRLQVPRLSWSCQSVLYALRWYLKL